LKKPIIGLDLKTLSLKYAGIGRYTSSLVQELTSRNQFSYVGFQSPSSDTSILKNIQLKYNQGITKIFNSTVLRSMLIPIDLSLNNIDLFHSLDNSTVRLLPLFPCIRVATIHDLIVFKHPEFFTRKHLTIVRNLINYATRQADHIITVSNSTKRDLLEIFPHLPEKNISVIYLAASPLFHPSNDMQSNELLKKLDIPKRYFLSVATYEPRKNLGNLITAFKSLRKKSSFNDISLVLVGGKGWLDAHVKNHVELLKKENIIPLGFIEDNLLPTIYSKALAFVYPSYYEGFGLPVLEAMSSGCPIITSKLSSLPEVAGNSALYIDPYSTKSITDALEKMAGNNHLREDLSDKSLKKSKEFSWRETAYQTENVYRKLLTGHN
jgi:glycosyltransferase involved in cell wall biosynthesis